MRQDHPRAIRTWRSLSCHPFCHMISRWLQHSVRPALCTNSSACASVKCTHRTHSASHHKHGMGTNQVLLEQTAPPRAACAIGIECRVRDAVRIELLHSPRRNSVRHIRLAECTHQERTLRGGRARRTHRPGARAAGADRAAAATAQPAIRAAAGGQPQACSNDRAR